MNDPGDPQHLTIEELESSLMCARGFLMKIRPPADNTLEPEEQEYREQEYRANCAAMVSRILELLDEFALRGLPPRC